MAGKTFIGTIVSDKMQNTIVVEIVTSIPHPLYGKKIKRTQRLKADTNNMEVKIGETVKIEETRPMSKDKNFKVIAIVSGKGEAESGKKQ